MSSLFELDIQNCKGVGPQRAKLFRKLGVPTVGDLLRLYPRAYEDWSQHCLIRDTSLNEVAVVKATVLRRPTEHRVKGGKLLYKTTVTDGDNDMALTFFNNKYIPTLLREGETYLFRGKVTGTFLRREMLAPGKGALHPAGVPGHGGALLPADWGGGEKRPGHAPRAAPRPPARPAAGEVPPVHPALRLGDHPLPQDTGGDCHRPVPADL